MHEMLSAYSADRQAVRDELERRSAGQRLTPAQRKIAECLVEHSSQIGFLSSVELADLAGVSQPSVTRFAVILGFKGYLEMRRFLRGIGGSGQEEKSRGNRFQAAAHAEIQNLSELASMLADDALLAEWGIALASSRPLPVLGLRAAVGLAARFCYFAAKIHPDVRELHGGGSLLEDQIEQAKSAGGKTLLVFMMPLYPRETIKAMEFARQIGLRIALVTDAGYKDYAKRADLMLPVRISTSMVFDSYAAPAALTSVLLDSLYGHMDGASKRLETLDRSSSKRKVFMAES